MRDVVMQPARIADATEVHCASKKMTFGMTAV